MKKWGLLLMVVGMLAAPMVACGFPLPAGTEMMAVSKAVCAEGEPTESCQMRQDAYQLMSKLQTASVTDLQMAMDMESEGEAMNIALTGRFDYEAAVSETSTLGANVHVWIDEGQMTEAGSTEALDALEFIVMDTTGYTSNDGGQTWVSEALDQDAMSGLGLILGLGGTSGTGLDMFNDPTTFAVTAGESVEYNGQMMNVQTLTLDLTGLLSNTEALSAMLTEGLAAGGDVGLDEEAMGGMTPEDFAMVAAMMLPFLEGTEMSTTIYIGADDGYIHYVEDHFVLSMDMSAFDPTQQPVFMNYQLSGYITGHNQPVSIAAPAGAVEGEGVFGEGGLFGSDSDLGGSLFGTTE